MVSYVDRARSSVFKEHARRGYILDAKGDVLATSRTVIQLGVDPQMLREEDRADWPELARLIGQPLEQLVSTFNRTKRISKTGNTSSFVGPSWSTKLRNPPTTPWVNSASKVYTETVLIVELILEIN